MIVRHSLLYVASKIIPGMLGVATTALLTRLLPPASYGLYGGALIVMTFGSSMVFDWVGLAFMRLYEARRDSPATVPTFVALYLGLVAVSAAGGLAAWAAGLLAPQPALWLAGLAMAIAYSGFELLARFAVADFRPAWTLAMSVGRGVLMLGATGGAALAGAPPAAIACATAAALFVACGLGARRGLWPWPGRLDLALAREAVRFGLPFALSMTLIGLTASGTRAVVGVLAGAVPLGFYTAAFALSQNVLVLVAAGIGQATYPAAVRAVERGETAALRRQLETNATVLAGLLAPASLGLALLAPSIAPVLVGHAYAGAVAALVPPMALASFLGGMRGCYLDHAFQLGRRPGLQVQVAAVAALVGVGGSAVLLPRLGAVGAADASALAALVGCVHARWLGRRAMALPFPAGAFGRVALGCAAMTPAVLAVGGDGWPAVVARVAAGAAAYGAVVVGTDLLGIRTS